MNFDEIYSAATGFLSKSTEAAKTPSTDVQNQVVAKATWVDKLSDAMTLYGGYRQMEYENEIADLRLDQYRTAGLPTPTKTVLNNVAAEAAPAPDYVKIGIMIFTGILVYKVVLK